MAGYCFRCTEHREKTRGVKQRIVPRDSLHLRQPHKITWVLTPSFLCLSHEVLQLSSAAQQVVFVVKHIAIVKIISHTSCLFRQWHVVISIQLPASRSHIIRILALPQWHVVIHQCINMHQRPAGIMQYERSRGN